MYRRSVFLQTPNKTAVRRGKEQTAEGRPSWRCVLRDGEKIYNGMFTYATFDEASLTADTLMGRNRLPAKFEVRCEQPYRCDRLLN